MSRVILLAVFGVAVCAVATLSPNAVAQKKQKVDWKMPALPDGKAFVTDTSEAFLKLPDGVTLKDGLASASGEEREQAHEPGDAEAVHVVRRGAGIETEAENEEGLRPVQEEAKEEEEAGPVLCGGDEGVGRKCD